MDIIVAGAIFLASFSNFLEKLVFRISSEFRSLSNPVYHMIDVLQCCSLMAPPHAFFAYLAVSLMDPLAVTEHTCATARWDYDHFFYFRLACPVITVLLCVEVTKFGPRTRLIQSRNTRSVGVTGLLLAYALIAKIAFSSLSCDDDKELYAFAVQETPFFLLSHSKPKPFTD